MNGEKIGDAIFIAVWIGAMLIWVAVMIAIATRMDF